ncbi:telomere-associated protein Tap [Streptomyces sp. 4F14]|uniref:telomere-associated protein Tap n=1 Tax=Streptomyces sp. 4F14 TaxID=3394380 RepID=UPI003A85FAAB
MPEPESGLFSRIDALVASRSALPPPPERKRLRTAHGLTLDEVAAALDVRRATVSGWESGRTEPRPPERDGYARLLKQLGELYPAVPDSPAPARDGFPASAKGDSPAPVKDAPAPAPEAVRETTPRPVEEITPRPARVAAPPATPAPAASAPTVVETPARPAEAPARPTATTPGPAAATPRPASRRPATKKAAKKPTPAQPATDPRFENGPLAVVDIEDGQASAYCVGGLVLDVPARSLSALVEWTLTDARLGQPRLHRHGRDADPVLVLTPAALERYGLPTALTEEERRAGRLPDSHKTVKQLLNAGWQLTQRGFGPWARIYRPAEGSRRQCVQVCIPAWNALDVREWDRKDSPVLPTMHPADLARYLGTYAQRVMTPRGTTAVTGLELMVALRPPTRAEKDETTGEWKRAFNPDALTAVYDVVECEVPDEHPLLKGRFARHHLRTPAEMLMEEPYDWCRPLTDEECGHPFLVAVDVNMSFAAAANGLTLGLNGPTHLTDNPAFDPSLPGSWLVDLSHVDLSRVRIDGHGVDADRLPSPFTPSGEPPDGPAWYATPTVAYAVELGFDVAPAEAYVRTGSGRYLDGWYKRLRDAYVATMADLGVTTDLTGQDFLAAMARSKEGDTVLGLLAGAVKATAKGGIGKLRQRNRGQVPYYEPWPALARETWRPDIRAAVLANQRIGIHRKLMKTAALAGVYPVAIGTDAVVYPSAGPSPLDALPHTAEGKPLPGGFRLGVSPGMVKHQGTRSVLWAEEQFEEAGTVFNLANLIKTGPDTGEGE